MPHPQRAEPKGVSEDTWDLIRGTFINLAGMGARSTRLLATLAVTNLFGPALFGLYDTGWKITFVLFKIGRFGLQQGVVRAVARARLNGREEEGYQAIAAGLAIALVSGLASVGLMLLGADALSRYYGQAQLAPALRLMAWSLPFMGLAAVFIAAIRALRIMKYGVYVHSIGGPLILLIGTLLAGLAGWGLAGLAGAQVASGLGMFIQSAIYFRTRFSLGTCLRSLRGRLPWKSLVHFSLPVMLSDVLTTAVWSLDQFILLKYAPAATVGLYAVARQVSTFAKKAPQAFDPILGPIVADLSFQRRTRELSNHLALVLRWGLTVNLVYLGGLWLVGDRLLLVFGPEFTGGLEILCILCLGMIACGASLPLESLLVMAGRPYLNLLDNGIWALSILGLSLWLIPLHGAWGAAWASTLSLILVAGIRLIQAYRLQGIRPFSRRHIKPLVAALIALIACELLEYWEPGPSSLFLGMELVLFLGIFGLVLYAQGVEEEDRLLVDRLRQRLRGKRKDPPAAETLIFHSEVED